MEKQYIRHRNRIILMLLSFIICGAFCVSSSFYLSRAEVNSRDENKIIDEYYYDTTSSDITSSYIGFASKTDYSDFTVHYVYTEKGSRVTAYKVKRVYSEEVIDDINSQFDSGFPNAQRIGDASMQYNCHSYAWYQRKTNNPYWIDEPEAYFTDGSYIETKSPRIGDRAVYYNKWDRVVHSAIIVAIGDSNDTSSITVESKWGMAGLYRHKIYYCSYASQCGGETKYIKFYTHANHVFDGICKNHDELKHKRSCKCGAYELKSHYVKVSTLTGRYARCEACGALLDTEKYFYPGVMKFKPGQVIIHNIV